MTVIQFPGHKWAHCTREDCSGCVYCHGGLATCLVCGGSEGSLPTDCPGERMSGETEDLVYAGELDYTRNVGWVRTPSKYCPGGSAA